MLLARANPAYFVSTFLWSLSVFTDTSRRVVLFSPVQPAWPDSFPEPDRAGYHEPSSRALGDAVIQIVYV